MVNIDITAVDDPPTATGLPTDVTVTEDVASSPTVEFEKRPKVFTIDLLRCVYCGFCVDACPNEAIRIVATTFDPATVSTVVMALLA